MQPDSTRCWPLPDWPVGSERARRAGLALLVAVVCQLLAGWASQPYLIRRQTPANPLTAQLQIASRSGPQVSQRTSLVLRAMLEELHRDDPLACLNAMQELIEAESDGELVYSISEVAYVQAKRLERHVARPKPLDLYGVAVSNAYMYLFSLEFDHIRNPYDPIFRGVVICTTSRWNARCD